MINVFISQPMHGKTNEEILAERKKAIDDIKYTLYEINHSKEEIHVINSFAKEDAPNSANAPLWYLAKSLELLATADIAYFAKEWDKYRGCIIEHKCAVLYGVTIWEH